MQGVLHQFAGPPRFAGSIDTGQVQQPSTTRFRSEAPGIAPRHFGERHLDENFDEITRTEPWAGRSALRALRRR